MIVQPSVYGADNSVTLDAIAGYGPDARGIAVAEADCSAAELRRLDEGGMRGARINLLFRGEIGLDDLDRLASCIAEVGWHR